MGWCFALNWTSKAMPTIKYDISVKYGKGVVYLGQKRQTKNVGRGK